MPKIDVLAAGNINTDISFFLDEMPGPDCETEALEYSIFQGGSAANFAVAAAKLGLNAGIVGCLGGDAFGDYALASLRGAGIDTSCVKVFEEERTGTVCILVDSNGRRMIAYRGANRNLASVLSLALPSSPTQDPKKPVEDSAGAKRDPDIIQLCNVKPEIISAVKGRASLLSVDPGSGARLLRTEDLKGIDLLMLNEAECRSITGLGYMDGSEMLNRFVGTVVVKLGAKGAFLSERGLKKMQPAFGTNVVDTTGAGDAFDAGFIAAVSCRKGPEEALVWGAGAAALKIQVRGARNGIPTREELLSFISSF